MAQKLENKALRQEIDELRIRLAEAEDALRAIHEGEVDAIIVSGTSGEQIFSLMGTESIYRLIVDTMKESAFTVAFDETILYCNAQFGEFVKHPLEQIVGHRLHEFVSETDLSTASSLIIAAQGRPIKQRLVFKAADGTHVPAHVSANVLNQPDSMSICVVASDLTELENSTELIQRLRRQQEAFQASNEELAATEEELRVQNEELNSSRSELERTRARYQDLFDNAPDGYIVTDSEGIIQEGNQAAARLFGRPAVNLKGNPFTALLPANERDGYLRTLAALSVDSSPFRWELQVNPPESSPFGAAITVAASRDEQGNIIGLRWLIRDITKRKQAEEALLRSQDELEQKVSEQTEELRKSNRTLRMISECNQAVVCVTDESELMHEICRIIVEIGSYRMAWVGYAEDDEMKTVRPVASIGFAERYLETARISWGGNERGRGPTGACIRTGEIRIGRNFLEDPELAPWRDEALKRGYRSSIALPLIADGKIFGALTIYAEEPEMFDAGQTLLLTELAENLAFGITVLRAQAERDQARQMAERRAEELRALAAELVRTEHKERRRLAQILHDHLQQLLVATKYGISALKAKSANAEIRESADRITSTMDEAISVSRSLSAELSPPILYEKGLAAALEWLARQMNQKHGLRVEIEADMAAEPANEEMRLFFFEAVRELLLNVIKYAKVDCAQVRLRNLETGDIEICVSDKGVGFDPAQIGGSTTGGFGLFSIRERLGYLGVRMTIDAAPGQGSRFIFVAPVSRATETKKAMAAKSAASAEGVLFPISDKISVLLAEDHPVTRHGLMSLLQAQPDIHVIGEAADGQSAVDYARRLKPDVVLMDISLPIMNGLDATRKIISECKGVQVIGLSMHEETDMSSAMREAGAIDYLAKGGPIERLISAIRACRK
jgi:PAS domain S-box-containing protein